MAELTPAQRSRAVGSLVASRAVYAFNWYNVGPIQIPIAAGLGVAFGEVSLALWSFLVGVGLFQIPAGLLALRWGARRVSLLGLVLMAAGAVAGPLLPLFPIFVVLRGLVGVGAACFFSPAIGLIARYYTGGGRGFGIGLFNGAFSLGAGAAVFLTVVLEGVLGWAGALLVAGLALVVVTAENAFALPALPERPPARSTAAPAVRAVLRSRYIWALALGLTGFWAANFAVAQYLVPWARTVLHFSPEAAGGLDALMIVTPLLGGPLGGSLAERRGEAAGLLALTAALTGGAIAAFPFLAEVSPLALWPLAALGGVVSGMTFGILYYMATLDPAARGPYVPLAVGLLNGVQVFLGAFLVLGLGYSVFGQQTATAYTLGWVLLGALTLALLPLLLPARARSGTGPGGRRDPPGGVAAPGVNSP